MKMPKPTARSAMTTMGTAIAAARAPLDIPVLFEGAALEEVGADCVVVEEDQWYLFVKMMRTLMLLQLLLERGSSSTLH
jgi:hypothetical protein